MTVIINDTNIFIDLCNVSLIDHFFQLPFEFHTVDFVINEINKNEQMDKVEPYITNKKLFVKQFAPPAKKAKKSTKKVENKVDVKTVEKKSKKNSIFFPIYAVR